MESKAIIIGIAGASGSGKTLVAHNILSNHPGEHVSIIEEDSYYKDLSDIPMDVRDKKNFDHPDSFDHQFLCNHLNDLVSGKEVKIPIYDYTIHSRSDEYRLLKTKHIIIVEGILLLNDPKLRKLLDIKIFVDTPADICLLRRVRRDINERGRSLDSVLEQYEATVRPMFLQFIEPSKRYADIILPMGGKNVVAIDLITTKINQLLHDHFIK